MLNHSQQALKLMRCRMDSEGPISLRAERGSELMLGGNLQRARVRAGGDVAAKSTVVNSSRHFSLFGTLERYFPFQTQLEIRLVKSRPATSSPLPLKTHNLCQGVEEKRPGALAGGDGVRTGCSGGCLGQRFRGFPNMLPVGPN